MNGTFAPAAPGLRLALALALGLAAAPVTAAAQDALDRTPNLSGGWIGVPWTVHSNLPHRFYDVRPGDGVDVATTTTFTHTLGLPGRMLAGLSWAILSPTAPEEPDELQPFLRHRLMGEERGFADVAVTGAWNSAAGSIDGELQLARWFGPVRLLGAGRVFSDARGAGDARGAVAAGAVWHPFAGRLGLAVAGDVASPLDRAPDEELAWSAGVQAGVPNTGISISLHMTNTAARTLQGASFAAPQTRYGAELAFTLPVGYLLGTYPDREAAVEAVVEEPDEAADVVLEIRRYAFTPGRLVVEPGTVVEWVNRDPAIHTATAEDGAWDSGGIPQGESWRARFDEPGIYPYYCGPHPYMKGVIIVR